MDSLIQFTFPVLSMSGEFPVNVIVNVRYDTTFSDSVVEIDQHEISGNVFKAIFLSAMSGTLIDIHGYLVSEDSAEKISTVLNYVEALTTVANNFKVK